MNRILEEKGFDRFAVDACQKFYAPVMGRPGNATMVDLYELESRTYISKPDRGRRRWKNKLDAQQAVYTNRRRIRGQRGKELWRRRGMMLERPFAHSLETGGMRRVHLRGRENILKRFLVHYAALNLGLLLHLKFDTGTPRSLHDLSGTYFAVQLALRCSHMLLQMHRELRQFDSEANLTIESVITHVSESPTSTSGC